jgi:hypothetical protein
MRMMGNDADNDNADNNAAGMVQAWVGQKCLKCDVFKTFSDVQS